MRCLQRYKEENCNVFLIDKNAEKREPGYSRNVIKFLYATNSTEYKEGRRTACLKESICSHTSMF